MKKLIIAVSLLTIAFTANAQWTLVYSGSDQARDIKFSTPADGYAVGGNGSLYKTNDSGNSWHWYNTGFATTNTLLSISFPSQMVGYIAGYNTGLVKTTNGGVIWDTVGASSLGVALGVFFTSVDTGYVCGGSGQILKTTNGGTSWSLLTTDCTFNLWKIIFTSSNTGYSVGEGGSILKTIDAGNTWTTLTSGVTYRLQSVFFYNDTLGFVVGDMGTILKTTNAGITWTPQTYGSNDWLFDVNFVTPLKGYIVGNADLYTNDGGTTWNSIGSPIIGSYTAITHVNSDIFVAGNYIYKTSSSLGTSTLNSSAKFDISEAIPNPSSEQAKLTFTLPAGANQGEISIYNATGLIVKTYKVDNTFGNLTIDNSTLPAGLYYYNLIAAGNTTVMKKMLVIR